jgi:hypothetical protein
MTHRKFSTHALILLATISSGLAACDPPESTVEDSAQLVTNTPVLHADGNIRWNRDAALKPQGPRYPDGSYMLFDDMMLDIAERVPGFGGFFVNEEEGVAYVWLLDGDEALLPRVERELRRYYGDSLDLTNGLRMLDADHDFRALKALQLLAIEHVLTWEGVVLADVDEAKNRVTVGVSTPEAQQRVLTFARQVGGSDALEVEFREPVKPIFQLTDSLRPVGGGLQIGPSGCTLGFVTARAGQLGFVTAAHCSAQFWGYDGGIATQNLNGGYIGSEVFDPPGWTGTVNGYTCPAGNVCRSSDAAFYSLAGDASPGGNRPIAWPQQLNTLTFESYGYVKYQSSPPVGTTVQKVGAASGRSKGIVSNSCYAQLAGGTNKIIVCSHHAPMTANPGDSGSPVFRNASNGAPVTPDLELYGVMWGSGGSFSSMGSIQADLGWLSATQ